MGGTVFIIGAGASAEVGLPTGIELKKQISESLNISYDDYGNVIKGDKVIGDAIKIKCNEHKIPFLIDNEYDEYVKAFLKIRNHLPLAASIDNYIDSNRDDQRISLCGKIAIVKNILDQEKESLIFKKDDQGSSLNYDILEKTWYGKFFHLITQSSNKKEAMDKLSRISFIIFNYDRCFEHFMYNGLKDFYSLGSEEIAELMNDLNIIHPYGTVGELIYNHKKDFTGFGASIASNELLQASNRIKTFTEKMDDKSDVTENLGELIGVAKSLIFLGFAFHPINMRLIKPIFKGIQKKYIIPKCYMTTYELSEYNSEDIKRHISKLFGRSHCDVMISSHFNAKSCTCADLFDEYSRGILI